jgi:hypothetical protein
MIDTGPWHLRVPTIEQENRFQRAILLHQLTDAWIKEMSGRSERPFEIERMSRVTLNPNLWLFEKTRLDDLPLDLGKLVGAQTIEEFLDELETTIQVIQLSTLENAFQDQPRPEELKNVLQKASWNHGKTRAEVIWKGGHMEEPVLAFHAFLEGCPFPPKSFLAERTCRTEFTFLWCHPPSRNRTLKDSSGAPLMESLYEEWIRGYFYTLGRALRLECKATTLPSGPALRFTLLSTS